MKKIVLLGFMFLTACATVKPMYTRDGVLVYRATCNGAARDIGDCYALASEQCAGEFEVVNSLEDRPMAFYNRSDDKYSSYGDGYRNTFGNSMGMKSNVINRSLFFYCKK